MRAKHMNDRTYQIVREKLSGYYRVIWDIMAFTGLRVGDVVALRHGDIDTQGYIHYRAQKTGKSGRIKLPDDIILLPRGTKGDGFIFPSPSVPGNHLSRQAVWKNIKKACKDAKIDPSGISPHSCRKKFAVDTYHREGLGQTMAKLQHSSPSTTFLYVFDDNPLEVFENKLKKTENELKTVKKMLKKLQYAIDLCCDRLLGDDSYSVTNEGRKALDVDLSTFDGNII